MDLRAIAEGSGIDWSNVGEIIVPVSIFDTEEPKVFATQITMNVKSSEPRKKTRIPLIGDRLRNIFP